ncbi:MAG TPA: hypothetical protein PKB06_07890, partial [Actinotalea sp.]|nr:hypothetical protein [Actinotalea sp.]
PLFGVSAPPRRSAAGVGSLGRDVRAAVQRLVGPARELVAALEAHAGLLRVVSGTGRLGTAQHGLDLLDRLSRESSDLLLLQVLAGAELPAEPQALGTSMATAADVAAQLRRADWDLLGRAPRLDGGDAALAPLRDAAGPVLAEAITAVRDLLLAQRPAGSGEGGVETRVTTVDDIVLVIENEAGGGEGSFDSVVGQLREAAQRARAQGKRVRVMWWIE